MNCQKEQFLAHDFDFVEIVVVVGQDLDENIVVELGDYLNREIK